MATNPQDFSGFDLNQLDMNDNETRQWVGQNIDFSDPDTKNWYDSVVNPPKEGPKKYGEDFVFKGDRTPFEGLGDDYESQYAALMQRAVSDPSVTEKDFNTLAKQFAPDNPGFGGSMDKYLAEVRSGKQQPNYAPSYGEGWDEYLAKKERTAGDRFYDSMRRGVLEGFGSSVVRAFDDWTNIQRSALEAANPGQTEEWYDENTLRLRNEAERALRDEIAARQENDSAFDPVSFIGGMVGAVGPEMLIPGGTGPLTRIGLAGATNAAADSVYQARDISNEQQDEFSPERLALNTVLGMGLQGALEVPGAISRAITPSAKEMPPLSPSQVEMVVPPAMTKKGKETVASQKRTARVQEIADTADSIRADWANAPETVVRENFRDLPDVESDAVGVFDAETGKVLLNAEAIRKEAEYRGITPQEMTKTVLFHETLGHYGLTQKFRDTLDETLDNMYRNSTFLQREADKWMEKNPDAYLDDPAGRHVRAVEEVFAEASERGEKHAKLYDLLKNKIKEFIRTVPGFKNVQFSKRELDTILAQAHAAVRNGKGADVRGNGYRSMYIGPSARLDSSEKAAAQTAYERGLQGEDVSPGGQVHQETGWFVGPEGRFRTEIPDIGVDFTWKFNNLKEHGEMADPFRVDSDEVPDGSDNFLQLDEVLIHPELFRRYPELADVRIVKQKGFMDFGRTLQGGFDPKNNTIIITPYAQDPLGTVIHEIQHWIQQKEKFSRGGNETTALNKATNDQLRAITEDSLYEASKKIAQLNAKLGALEYVSELPSAKAYGDAYKTWAEMSGNPELRDSQATHEAWRAKNEAQDVFRKEVFGTTRLSDLRKQSPRDYDQAWEIEKAIEGDTQMAIIDTEAAIDAATMRARKISESKNRKELIKNLKASDDRVGFKAYEALFGEIEARDTANRMGLTAVERAERTPYESEGYSPDEYIIDVEGEASPSESRLRSMRSTFGKSEGGLQGAGAKVEREKGDTTAVNKARSTRVIEEELKLGPREGQTFNQWIEDAEDIKFSQKAAESLKVGAKPAELLAAEKMVVRLSNTIKDIEGKMKDGTATPHESHLYARAIEKNERIKEAIMEVVTNASHILNARKIEVASDDRIRDSQLRRMMASAKDRALLETEEGRLKFAKKLVRNEKKAKLLELPLKVLQETVNVGRALISSMDVSGPLRQGFYLIGRKNFWKNYPGMYRVMLSQSAYDEAMYEITHRATTPLMKKAGLRLTNLDKNLGFREEKFQSNLAPKIPFIGAGVRASERAYSGFLNKLAADTFDDMVRAAQRDGIDVAQDTELLKSIASFVNAAVGRGNLGSLEAAAGPLATGLFSPRLIASRLKLLANPGTYITQPKVVRQEALKSLLSTSGIAATVLSLAGLAGAEVETDPRSSDFLKIKIGDTRYDVLGGFGQYLTLGARLYSNQTKNSKGTIKNLGEGFKADTRWDVLGKFFSNKAAPAASFAIDYLRGANAVGEEFNVLEKNPVKNPVINRFIPLVIQDMAELVDRNGLIKGLGMSAPTVFGIGTQSYDSWDRFEEKIGQDPSKEASPVTQELIRLSEGQDRDVIQGAPSSFRDGGEKFELDDDMKKEWTEYMGNLIQEFVAEDMATEEYKNASDEEKRQIVKDARSDAYLETKRYFLDKYWPIEEEGFEE